MIDTHTHIYGPEFDEDRDQVVQRAKQAGVSHVILPAVDAESVQQMKQMQLDYPDFCSRAIGLHPEGVRENYQQQLQFVQDELQNGGYIAVGEIGTDFYWDKTYQIEQEKAFVQQVEWALEYNLPLIIHTRESLARTLQLLQPYKGSALRGVFHCFGGDVQDAQAIFSAGDFKIGIGGIVTFKKSQIPDVLPEIGVDRILLETDSPYLAPVPNRGKRNESANIPHICRCIASHLGLNEEDVSQITDENAKVLFGV